jgi:membrane fusion protein (multidrug efflux system)
VVVPQDALIADQEGIYVFVVEDGKAAVKRIKPAGEIGADVVVEQVLSGGEREGCRAKGRLQEQGRLGTKRG